MVKWVGRKSLVRLQQVDEGVDDLVASCWCGLRAERFVGGDMEFVTGRTLALLVAANVQEITKTPVDRGSYR